MNPSILYLGVPAGLVAVIAIIILAFVARRTGARRHDLRGLVTLLRATDPATRVQALERAQALPARPRSSLGRTLRHDLAVSARAGGHPPQQAITVWFIRQVLALLADPRGNVRSDAARLLGTMMGGGVSQLAAGADGTVPLASAVAAAAELAGGRALAESDRMVGETRVLALAEMLEAGLRPLAIGLRALQGVEEEALGPLSSALRDRSPRVRQSLVEVLAAMGGEKAVSLLVPLLQDPSPELRAQALRALAGLRGEHTAAPIAELLGDPVAEVRAAAAAALAELAAKTHCRAVLAALAEEARREDSAEAARAAMIESAVKLSDGGLPALARALPSLPRPIARRLAAALEAGGAVESWLSRSDWQGQEELLSSLLASVAELGVSRPLLEALDSTSDTVRLMAATALGHSREPAALTATAALLNDPESLVRVQAVRSIAQHAQPQALPALAAAVSDPDGGVRRTAVAGIRDTLAQRSNWRAEALPTDFDLPAALAESQRALLQGTRDSAPEIRAPAAAGLGSFDSLAAASALADLALQDEQAAVREAATEALASSPFPHKQRLLAAGTEDPLPARRARAIAVLAGIAPVDSAGQIVAGLGDDSEEVRMAALDALALLHPAAVTAELVRFLKSEDARVRAGVARRLGDAPNALAVEGLVQALSDPEEGVRVNALQALAGLGRAVRRHQSSLMARRSDPSPRVREAADAALSQLRASWSEAAETAELLRQGPLSPAAAAVVVEMAAAGDVELLLRSVGRQQADEVIVALLAGDDRDKLPAVFAALRKAPEQDQARVASALAGALRQGAPAEAFLAQLKALDSEVRLIAVEIAGRLGGEQAMDALIEVLQRDPVADVRSRAASALADAPVHAAEEALRRALQEDPNNIVRRVAARALDRGKENGDGAPIPTDLAEGARSSEGAAPSAAG